MLDDKIGNLPPLEPPVPEQASEQPKSLNETLKFGYVVGLDKENNFVFQLLGEQKGLVELLGIHRYAQTAVESILARETMTGDRLHVEVIQALNLLTQKVDTIIKASKKPDNVLK